MVTKETCDNCGKEISYKSRGRIYFTKYGFFNEDEFDYDFCSRKCLKEIMKELFPNKKIEEEDEQK